MAATFLKLPDAILIPILQDIIDNGWGNGGPGNMSVGLYASPHVPAAGDVAATYTAIEAAFPGYVRLLIATAAWGAPTLTLHQASSLATLCTFAYALSAGPSVQAYGYFVLNPGLALAWAQLFPAPVTFALPGDRYSFTPQFSYLSQH